ncbi:MAG: alpha-ketoacid dehydrogenase subunit beta [Candidatus Omnitrophica bacterium]|nr:alpha-ketoacid dehydrogenase subunit beta [Candidatus Omnitrophota bacterium]MBU0895737.1 alpha-ketoacid dehydrogenase subunit beta [Candidatus Omnitrophota bacterium]MBU1808389.1 alpha-ketoacid dehydrogenase subunit beta [Candidatus Omnitrophota bacterium]
MPWTKMYIEKKGLDFDEHPDKDLRKLTVPEAMRETLDRALDMDKRVFVMGQGVDDHSGMFGMTIGLQKKYGIKRVFDTPLSENGLTGIGVGAALTGMRPIYFHNRPDFLLLAMDQIVNHAAKYSYIFAGKVKVPLIIVAVIGRGWGSGAQHSQSLHGLFMHVPGLRLVMPSTAYDAKGLLVTSLADGNPVIFIEHRWLFKHKSHVPEDLYSIPFGRGLIRRKGKDVTIVGISYMVIEALAAAEDLEKEGYGAEVIDPRTLRPLDEEIILESVKKTGRLVIADTDWKTCGAASEIASMVAQKGFRYLKAPIRIVAWPDLPVPSGHILEEAFYPGKDDIIKSVKEIVER